MKKYCGASVRFFVAAIFLSAFNIVFAQIESTPQIRRKTFEKVWRTVNDKFFDANFNGVDWRKMRERYKPRTPKGVVVGGRGVVPDIEVGLTRAGLLAGRDAQLEAAIEYIKNGKR